MRLLHKVLYVLALLSMSVPLLTWLLPKSLLAQLFSHTVIEEPEFAIVVCRDKDDSPKKANDFQRQLRQISVLFKSAATLTAQTVTFNIVADSYTTYETITNLTASWPTAYRQRLVFSEYKQVFYPPGTKKIKNLFRPCATGKLFLPQTLQDKDAVVFLDTDTLFLMPPEMLWRKLYAFNPSQIIGIAPCLHECSTVFKNLPIYGSRHGLNTGVLVMNLTRVRGFEGGWTENIMHIVNKYNTKLQLADQDILNILFSNKTIAKQLYQLGCEWNYRPNLCSSGTNKCKSANELGVGLLHGNALTFVNGIVIKFKIMFDAWEQHQIGESVTALLERLKTTLHQQNKSPGCSSVLFIDRILLQGLENTLKRHQ